ncbi:unnamed protein product [Arabidopsis halleri]
MEQIRGSNQLVLTVTCLICLWFSVGISSDSDPLIKPYVTLSLPSKDGLVSSVQNITEVEWYSHVQNSKVPVMVVVITRECEPCRSLLPTLSKLDLEYKDQFKFYTMDADDGPTITDIYSIRTFPTTIVVKNGDHVAQNAGTEPEDLYYLVNLFL